MIVAQETKLDYPLQDGSTKRKHLESIAKQSGEQPEELIVPWELHPAMLYMKYVFSCLSLTRQFNNGHPMLIQEADVYYWCKLHNTQLNEWQLQTLKKLDIAAINSLVDCIKEQQ